MQKGFIPLGFGDSWQPAVATILGLVAKEQVVGTFGTLSEMLGAGVDIMGEMEEGLSASAVLIGQEFFGGSKLAGFSFMAFNLLCAPCFAAMGAIKREMNSPRWAIFAIGYMCVFAYCAALVVYQLGLAFSGAMNPVGLAAALAILAFVFYMMFIKKYQEADRLLVK